MPSEIALDSSDNLYIADGNSVVRKVTASTGIISTVAGNGTFGSSGNGGAATSARLWIPSGLALDSSGNLYIADSANNTVRKVTASTGIISAVAGTGTYGFSGDAGAATSAKLNFPGGIAVDQSGNLYIADQQNHVVRRVAADTGIISTIAGSYRSGYWGDKGPAIGSGLMTPRGVAITFSGVLYIVDPGNNNVRLVH